MSFEKEKEKKKKRKKNEKKRIKENSMKRTERICPALFGILIDIYAGYAPGGEIGWKGVEVVLGEERVWS